jgi:hypothetical protein
MANYTGFVNYNNREKGERYNGFEAFWELAGPHGAFFIFFVPRGLRGLRSALALAARKCRHQRDMVSYGYAYIPDPNCPECKGTGVNETETTYYCQTCQKAAI